MDGSGRVDAVVYPGLLSDISSMMAAATGELRSPRYAERCERYPTVVFPVGVRQRGTADHIQLLGRAWTMTSSSHGVCVREIANVAGMGMSRRLRHRRYRM